MRLINVVLFLTAIVCRHALAQQCSSNGTLAAGGSQLNQTTMANFCLDKNNNVYVADSFNNRVLVWYQRAATGTVIASQIDDNLVVIADVFVLQSSGEIYILDWAFIGYRVQIWNIKTNNGIWVAGGNGTKYESDGPQKLFVDNKRNIYILLWSDTIVKWNAGAWQGTVVVGGNGRGSASNQLSNALDFYVDNQETIYIADFDNDRIQKWSKGSSSGTTIVSGKALLATSQNDLTQIWSPYSVVGDENGNLYISDLFTRVVKWSANAKTGTLFIGGNVLKYSVDPEQIRWASDGALYVYSFFDYSTLQANQRIERFNCSASATTTMTSSSTTSIMTTKTSTSTRRTTTSTSKSRTSSTSSSTSSTTSKKTTTTTTTKTTKTSVTTVTTTTGYACYTFSPSSLTTLSGNASTTWLPHIYNYTATKTAPILIFGFHATMSMYIAIDDVSVVDIAFPTIQLLNNPSFENSSTDATGWTKWCTYTCNPGSSGNVTTTACHSGKCYASGCHGVGGTDYLGQGFPAVIGRTYSISFWSQRVRFSIISSSAVTLYAGIV